MLLLEQMVVLFILMGIGYYCAKKAVITEEVSKKLSMIVVNIANPAMILTGCMGDNKIEGRELLTTVVIIVAIYAALLLMAQILPLFLRIDQKSQGTYKAMTVFSNIGFMGFPVIAALYGNSALLYGSLFTIPYNILIYTYGVAVMKTGEKKGGFLETFAPSRIFSIGVLACVVTMVIYLFQIPVPGFVEITVTHLGNLTAPLSMMVIGASLAALNLKELFTDGKLLLFSLIKLLVIPIAGVLLIRQFVDNEVICGVCMVMLATPVGSMTAMLAQQYEGDYEMASKGVALTTILSVVTMPIVAMLV